MYENETLQKIHRELQKRRWTMYKLAKEADIPYSSLNSMFNKNTTPTIPTLEKICNGLGISLSDFFADENYVKEYTPYTSEEYELLTIFRNLPDYEQNIMISMSKSLQEIPPKSTSDESKDSAQSPTSSHPKEEKEKEDTK